MRPSRLGLAIAAAALIAAPATVRASAWSSAGTRASWSTPATLSACGALGPARAVFPKDSPSHGTGRGAVVWTAARDCPGGESAFVSAIASNDVPQRAGLAQVRGGRRLTTRAPLAGTGGPHGQIVISSPAPAPAASGGWLAQGPAGGPFSAPSALPAPASQSALATGYLGDVAVASPTRRDRGTSVAVSVERYFARSFSPRSTVAGLGDGPVQGLTVALDYRTDAIAVWRQAGAIYAHDLPASETPQVTQRLAWSAPNPTITALISDDNRAIVAWADRRGTQTSIYLDMSSSGVRFGKPRLLERFAEPGGVSSTGTSPRLIRLSSESVMIAWNGVQAGRWVVRTAAIDLRGLRAVSTISPVDADALLEDLQPGPDGEALALWGEPQRTAQGRLDLNHQSLFAARGIDAAPGRTIFTEPEQIATAGPNRDATVALDPTSDRALALWRGRGGSLQYAIRGSPDR